MVIWDRVFILTLILVLVFILVPSASSVSPPLFTITDLGALSGTESQGLSINNSGQVAGWYRTVNGAQRAFFWDGTTIRDIGDLGGGQAIGYGINSAGHITGISYAFSGGPGRAFVWNGTTMKDIGTLRGGAGASGAGINDYDQITGTSSTPDIFTQHAILWTPGASPGLPFANLSLNITPTGVIPGSSVACSGTDATEYLIYDVYPYGYSPGVIRRAPCLGGTATFQSFDLNSYVTSNGPYPNWLDYIRLPLKLFVKNTTGLYAPGGDYTIPINLSGGFNNYNQSAYSPDDNTWPTLAGGPQFNFNGTNWINYTYASGTMQDIGTLEGHSSFGNGINNSGQITGSAYVFTPSAFSFENHAFFWNGTTMQDIGTLGRLSSVGTFINNSGYITGGVGGSIGGNLFSRAFFWNGTTMQEIGSIFGASGGNAINNLGQVVGSSDGGASFPTSHAFFWDGSTIWDLNNQLVNGSSWTELTSAQGINDLGQITGYGSTTGGQVHAFLLTPVSTGGTISVTTNLSIATFNITGPANYSGTGTSFSVTNAPPGSYTITYGTVSGYTTPISETKSVTAGGNITFSGIYVLLPTTGTINVSTNLSAATFTITGAATYTGSGTSFTKTSAPTGAYTIRYGEVAGYTTPPNQGLTLSSGGSITFNGVYKPSPTFFGAPGPTKRHGIIAEPVNTATGNYYTSHTDLQVPGKGLSFAFTRYYNSLDTYAGPLGAGWTHSYNISLRQISGMVVIKEGDGHEDVFNPTGGANYVPQTPGLFDSLRMNVDGSFTLTRKNQTQLNFYPNGILSAVIDRNGNTQTLLYSGTNLTSITDSSGRVFTLNYDGSNRLVALSDPLGRVLHYGYDSNGNLASFQDAEGNLTQYSYDRSHHMTSAIDPRGNMYLENTYDAQDRVISQGNARGFTTIFAYDTPTNGITTVTDPLGNVTQHVHDSNLRLIRIIDALGGVTSYTCSLNNLRLSATDPLGRTQSFTYDASGNLASATDPAGKTTQFIYDVKNNLTQIMDRLGRITRLSYDSRSNLVSVIDASGNSSGFTYDSAGQVITAKNARNFSTSFSYDAAGNLIGVTDALGGNIQMRYDAAGRLLSVRNQLGNTTRRIYDYNDRLVSIADPLANNTQFAYDANGNLLQITDANGQITRYAYDSTNKLVQVTDSIGGVTRYTYDPNTDLNSVTDAKNHTTNYSYGALRRLNTTTDPLGKQKHYHYDGVGNVTATVDGNGKSNAFAYDAVNRSISMALSDGKTVSYTYDAVGNRLTMTDWHGTTHYVSDLLNRIVSVTTPDGKTIGYSYDAVGNRVRLGYPDGNTVRYQHDSLNRLASVIDWNGNTTTYTYDAAGNLTETAQPNRTASSYTYDAANRLLSVVNTSKNHVLSAFSYGLDKVGNRLQVTSSRGDVTRYEYDGLYRLTSWISPGGQITRYIYDAVGNRGSMISPAGTTSYSYDAADELISAGSTTFTYDGNGNQVSKALGGSSTCSYSWDALNRLISVSGTGINTQYAYDGDGNRIRQQSSAGTYLYANDSVTALPVVLDEAGPDGNIEYVSGLSLVSENVGSKQYFYQFDGLGSVTTMTNEAGAHQANYGYDPWGQPTTPAEPPIGLDALGTKNKYTFTGEASDPNDRLFFLQTRYYDPSLGRFISRDPFAGFITYPLTMNRYGYALANPLRFSDPSGQSVTEFGSGSKTGTYTSQSLDVLTLGNYRAKPAIASSEVKAIWAETGIRILAAYFTNGASEVLFGGKEIYDVADKIADAVVAWQPVISDLRDTSNGLAPKTWGGGTLKLMKCNLDLDCTGF